MIYSVQTVDYLLTPQFVENGSLLDHVRSSPVAIDRKLKIVKGIVNGMWHLHKERIFHRDLACRNVLLCYIILPHDICELGHVYTPKVCDFGLSRTTMPVDDAPITSSGVTKSIDRWRFSF